MSLGEILFIYRARLRQRSVAVQELLAMFGIAVGVALLFASQVASTSLDGSVRQLSKQLVGEMQYQLDARGPEGVSERVVARARSLPGVRAALPLLEQEASVIGPAGRASVELIGADPRFASLGGPLLRHFSTRQLAFQEAIALPAPIAAAIGAGPPLVQASALEHDGSGAAGSSRRRVTSRPLELQIGAHVVRTILGITLQEAEVGALVHSQVALAPVAYAQQVGGMTRTGHPCLRAGAPRTRGAGPGGGLQRSPRRGISTSSPPTLTRRCSRGRLGAGGAGRESLLCCQRNRRLLVRVQRDVAHRA